ncbi:CynX/NimT family MFS transporter [Bradyrhizobium sp. RDM4]|uniref:MFS transporter n=1 Tax=Bradyrhizobium sp. RDM4 TaxID=3378765 RepID=UPI0038FCE59B
MAQRWKILAVLFVVRLSMAFQFQSVASLSPAMIKTYGVGLGDIGVLISLYLAPGIAFALPGGEIGRRFGDKRVVLAGLALMTAGGLLMAFAPSWGLQIAGRVVAGIGGVVLNVLMSKMVTDWFAGREIATAMAIFVNSWPAGIALCLFLLPTIAAASGITTALLVTAAFCALGFLLLAALYQPPLRDDTAVRTPAAWPSQAATRAMIVAGAIWGLFNAALGMVFGFGTILLVERGWSLPAAGSATSLVLWIVSLSVPFGGVLADRTGKHIEIMLVGFALFAVALVIATRADAVIPVFVALGLVGGLSAGPIMSLPARVLTPPVRAVGMGIHFALFYAFAVAAPVIAGAFSSRVGTAGAAFDLGAFMLALGFPAYWIFNRLAPRKAHAH